MKKNLLKLDELLLIGLKIRTSNAAEMDPKTAQIGACIQKYFELGGGSKLSHRKNPGVTYAVYTEYESDASGPYTYIIGEEVSALDDIPEAYSSLIIPAQKYMKFTTDSGGMPQVCINAWIDIWGMTEEELGAERSFVADFEFYDERATDPDNTVLDIFIGIK